MLLRLTPGLYISEKSYSVTIWKLLILKSTSGTGNALFVFLRLSKWHFGFFFSLVLGALESERVKEMLSFQYGYILVDTFFV